MRQIIAALTGNCEDALTRNIIINIRLLKAVTALLTGIALSAGGLQMQTLFRNPLAGPYVLGVSAGASLGVAIFILGAPLAGVAAGSLTGSLSTAAAAWIGAAAVMSAVLALSRRIKDIMVILILGMMCSSAIGAVVEILQYLSDEQSLKSFVVWTMGSLGDVTVAQLWIMIAVTGIGSVLAIIAVKPLNILLLGEQYARSMGLNLQRARRVMILSTTLLAATVTAFCGPIGFIGLAVPHLARMLWRTSDHRTLMPATMLTGAIMMLACDIISKTFTLPVNTITALMGIPVVIYIVTRNRSIAQ